MKEHSFKTWFTGVVGRVVTGFLVFGSTSGGVNGISGYFSRRVRSIFSSIKLFLYGIYSLSEVQVKENNSNSQVYGGTK